MSWSFFKRFGGTNVKFCFAEQLVRWLFAKICTAGTSLNKVANIILYKCGS